LILTGDLEAGEDLEPETVTETEPDTEFVTDETNDVLGDTDPTNDSVWLIEIEVVIEFEFEFVAENEFEFEFEGFEQYLNTRLLPQSATQRAWVRMESYLAN